MLLVACSFLSGCIVVAIPRESAPIVSVPVVGRIAHFQNANVKINQYERGSIGGFKETTASAREVNGIAMALADAGYFTNLYYYPAINQGSDININIRLYWHVSDFLLSVCYATAFSFGVIPCGARKSLDFEIEIIAKDGVKLYGSTSKGSIAYYMGAIFYPYAIFHSENDITNKSLDFEAQLVERRLKAALTKLNGAKEL